MLLPPLSQHPGLLAPAGPHWEDPRDRLLVLLRMTVRADLALAPPITNRIRDHVYPGQRVVLSGVPLPDF